jgi:hypothetical protein
MPGAIFMHQYESFQPTQGQNVPASAIPNGATDLWQFLLWYVVIGFLIPGVIYGGLRLGGFQFVFRSR